VAQFIDHDRNEWDFGKLSQQFDEESVAAILNIPRRNWVQQDTWCWTLTTNGQMTVKSAYKEFCLHASQSGSAPVMEKNLETLYS
jgi:hypothetical protein